MEKSKNGMVMEVKINMKSEQTIGYDPIKLTTLTEKIVIDGKSFNVKTDEAVKYFFGVRRYVFHLKATR